MSNCKNKVSMWCPPRVYTEPDLVPLSPNKILKLKAMGFGKYKTVGCGSAGFDGVTILCVKCNRY